MFQCCTEYGWWQTISDVHSLRSKKVNIESYKRLCETTFGKGVWPNADRKNNEYGGVDIRATNLLMSNGWEGIFFIFTQILGNGPVSKPRATILLQE